MSKKIATTFFKNKIGKKEPVGDVFSGYLVIFPAILPPLPLPLPLPYLPPTPPHPSYVKAGHS